VTLLLLSLAACESDNSVNRIEAPPTVAIVSPEPMAVIRKGSGGALFVAEVEDSWDLPEDLTVSWTLDQGAEAPGTVSASGDATWSLDVEDMDYGEYRTEITVTDTDGDLAIAGLQWVLGPPLSAPQVTITSPDDFSLFEPGTEITFRGEAFDDVIDELIYGWSSSIDGELEGALSGGGESALFTDRLSDGTHIIALEVTDADDEVGIDTIEVTIGELQSPAQVGDLVFSELMINPSVVADELGEWVELYNTASYAIDIQGYRFHDDDFDEYFIDDSMVVPGGTYVVLCADTNPSSNGGVTCDGPFKRKSADALALGNGTDEVILSRDDGVVIDSVYYDSDWFTVSVAIGVDPEYLSADNNDSASNWCDQTTVMTSGGEPGTPGRSNDPCP
jgi:hypothetical protein